MRESLTGTPSCRTGAGRAWLVELDDHLARAHERGVERLLELEHRLQAAVVLGRERRPLRARAGGEDRLDLAVGRGRRRVELALEQVLAPDARAPRRPELRLERAEGHVPPSAQRVGAVAEQGAAEHDLPAARAAPAARRARRAATIASQDSAPSAIETSTSWPSPERSRSRSAARIPNAAISAPPPRSAIWPAACTGGPSRLAREREQPDQPEVVEVVARAPA